jgi:hypothetical protein
MTPINQLINWSIMQWENPNDNLENRISYFGNSAFPLALLSIAPFLVTYTPVQEAFQYYLIQNR